MNHGYTLVEPSLTLGILAVLCCISMIAIAGPKNALETTFHPTLVSALIQKAQTKSLLSGESITLSFTPSTIWVNEQKELLLDAPWHIETRINRLKLLANGQIEMVLETGELTVADEIVRLFYKNAQVLNILVYPKSDAIRFQTRIEKHDETCKN